MAIAHQMLIILHCMLTQGQRELSPWSPSGWVSGTAGNARLYDLHRRSVAFKRNKSAGR